MLTVIARTPAGQAVTLEDRRPGRRAPPQLEPVRLKYTMGDVAGHEGRHCAAAALFGFKMVEARADIPHTDRYGHVTLDITDEDWQPIRLAENAVALLAGGIGEEGWPPSWPLNPHATEGDERALADLAHRLNLNATQWHGLIDIANTIATHRGFKRLVRSFETLLSEGVVLNEKMIEHTIRHAKGELERIAESERPPTPEERDHADLVAEHRDAMLGRLTAYDKHRQQIERELAHEKQRRELDAISRELDAERWT